MVSLIVFLTLTIVRLSHEIEEELEKAELADEIHRLTTEIAVLSGEYIIHHEKGTEQQWEFKFESIMKSVNKSGNILLFNEISEDLIFLNNSFRKLKSNYENRNKLMNENASRKELQHTFDLENRLAALIRTDSLKMWTKAFEIAEESRKEVIAKQRRAGLLHTYFAFLLFAVIGISTTVIARSISKPIDKLVEGAEIVGNGNLDHRVEITGGDETGYLGRAFNEMVEKRRIVEDALRKNESKYRTLIENLPQKIFFKDRNSVYISCNENYARDLKIGVNEISGMDDYDFYPQELAERYRSDDKRIIETLSIEDIEEPYIQNGNQFWVHTVKTPVKDEKGETTGILAIFWDITEKKKAEEQLFVVQSAVDKAGESIFLIDKDAKILNVNEAVCRSLGYSREELLSMTVADFDPSFPIEKWPDHWKELKEKGSLIFETIHRDKNGAEFQVEVRVNYVASGDKEYNFAFARDITERKKAEEKLKGSEAKYRSLFENMRNGFALHEIIVDDKNQPVDYVFLEINTTFESLTGLKRENVVGRRVTEIIPGIEKSEFDWIGEYGKVALEEEVLKFEQYSEALNKYYSVTAYSPGKGYFAVVFDDITERKKVEEAILKSNEELDQRVKERTMELEDAQEQLVRKEKLAAAGQIASSIGHELRNPLGVIGNSVYYLKTKFREGDEKLVRHLDILQREIDKSRTIISELLDFSRASVPSLEQININSIVKKTLAEMEVSEIIDLETALHEGLPEVNADPGQIQQVFQNIILNAVQAMPEGGRLEIRTGTGDGFIEIIFKDTGGGISEENLRKIFEPLFTTKAKGIGLGLSIVKSIIDRHKGEIDVESEDGKGTTFTVKLAIKDDLEKT